MLAENYFKNCFLCVRVFEILEIFIIVVPTTFTSRFIILSISNIQSVISRVEHMATSWALILVKERTHTN